MVHGKLGLKMEAWKFGVYLAIPIFASIVYNDPDVQRVSADYFQFLKYPANPNTSLKEDFEKLRKQRELEKEQRKLYAEQMKKLQMSAQRSREEKDKDMAKNEGKRDWFRWMRFRRGGGTSPTSGGSSE